MREGRRGAGEGEERKWERKANGEGEEGVGERDESRERGK